jgi:aldehyde dehydrogenase (NAD+)/betaine-aldehyde dehydrogenase
VRGADRQARPVEGINATGGPEPVAAKATSDIFLQTTWRHFIAGRYVEGDGELLEVENPATGEVMAQLAQVSPRQVATAVVAARQAFESGIWRDGGMRAVVLSRLADVLESRNERLLHTLVSEIGTPISIAKFLQLDGPIDMLRDIAKRASVDRTVRLPNDERAPASASMIRYEPVGVVAGIGAYNNPLLYLVSKCCAAMAAGCTAVYLPSSLTPLTALSIADIIQEAGVPDGVLNIIAGGPDVARALTLNPDVGKISLTGSMGVGRQVMRQAAEGLKGIVLELGGKSAGIVLPGADLAKIMLPLHGRYLRNAGQGCQSPTRLLIPAPLYDDFVEASRQAYASIPIGDPLDPKTMIGPLISEAHRAKVEGFVARALEDGGEILAGGGRPDIDRGWYMNGAMIGGMTNTSEIARNELFGPVAMLMPYRDVEHAINIANDSEFGLAASVFGPLDEALAVAARLRVGTVAINGGGNFRVDSVLVGWKHSGFGREWGEAGIGEFLQAQHVQWML